MPPGAAVEVSDEGRNVGQNGVRIKKEELISKLEENIENVPDREQKLRDEFEEWLPKFLKGDTDRFTGSRSALHIESKKRELEDMLALVKASIDDIFVLSITDFKFYYLGEGTGRGI